MKTRLLTTFVLALLYIGIADAQVTIGAAIPPIEGALLDLKQEGESTKGLGLPVVELTTLDPNKNELAESIGSSSGDTPWDENEHIGLMVYNISEDICHPTIGLYVWRGKSWEGLNIEEEGPIDVRTVTDDNDGIITLTYKDETTTYRYSQFGAAGTWLTENLATQYLPNGELLPKNTIFIGAHPNSQVEPQYNIAGVKETLTGKEGMLYNWAAAMAGFLCDGEVEQGQVEGPIPGPNEVESLRGTIQGICPLGWHLPSDREWNELEKEITEHAELYTQTPLANSIWDSSWETTTDRSDTRHGKAMETKNIRVNDTSPGGDSKSASDGGFEGLLTGQSNGGSAGLYGNAFRAWSSSGSLHTNPSQPGTCAWYRGLANSTTEMCRHNNYQRYYLFSVRCKKD